jgi:hypothetical protein
MKPSGYEPATFGLVAQCFNQLRHSVGSSNTQDINYYLIQKLSLNCTFNCHRRKNNKKMHNCMPWYIREESCKIKRYVELQYVIVPPVLYSRLKKFNFIRFKLSPSLDMNEQTEQALCTCTCSFVNHVTDGK